MEQDEFANLAMMEVDAVHRLACHLSSREEVVEELVHETFRRAFEADRGLKLAAGNLRPWLFKLLCDAAKARLGDEISPATPAERVVKDLADPVPGQTPCCFDLSGLDWGRAGGQLTRAVGELPLPYRAIFLLWSVERLGNHQIAQILRLPEGLVRERLYRARLIVSTELGECATDWRMVGAAETRDA